VLEAVADGQVGVARAVFAVHGREEEVSEREVLVTLRLGALLWEDELQLVACAQHEVGPGLGTDADPVEARGGALRPVRLHRHLEAGRMQRADERRVELEERLAPGADDERPGARAGGRLEGARPPGRVGSPRPRGGDRGGQGLRRGELAAALAVGADEIGVAEAAGGRRAVGLAPRPEVAAGEAAEDRRPAGVRPLALQRVEDLLHRVRHGVAR
jgi:hypothetical protein